MYRLPRAVFFAFSDGGKWGARPRWNVGGRTEPPTETRAAIGGANRNPRPRGRSPRKTRPPKTPHKRRRQRRRVGRRAGNEAAAAARRSGQGRTARASEASGDPREKGGSPRGARATEAKPRAEASARQRRDEPTQSEPKGREERRERRSGGQARRRSRRPEGRSGLPGDGTASTARSGGKAARRPPAEETAKRRRAGRQSRPPAAEARQAFTSRRSGAGKPKSARGTERGTRRPRARRVPQKPASGEQPRPGERAGDRPRRLRRGRRDSTPRDERRVAATPRQRAGEGAKVGGGLPPQPSRPEGERGTTAGRRLYLI